MMESPNSMRGPSPEASGEAIGPEGDDSNMGTVPTSGPEATSSQGIVLKPAEAIALTVALAQVLRGEEPTPNIATVCVLALARLTGNYDWTDDPTDYRTDPCNQPENIR